MKTLTKTVMAVAGIVILTGLGVGVPAIWPSGQATADNKAEEDRGTRIPVVLTPAQEMTFESTVVVAGNVLAKNFALVSARIPGPLDEIYVDEGDAVQAGQTRLFQTDSLKLTKAVAIARQGLQVAELAVQEKATNLERMQASLEQAQVDLERYRVLIQDHAIPRQVFDQQETGWKLAAAGVRHAQALLELDKTKLEQARLSMAIAEKDLADSLVMAPLSGKVSQRFMEPGEMAGAGTPVVKIEDLSVLEVSVFLPEEVYAQVIPGKTRMRIQVSGTDLGARAVSYKSPTVNPKLRTFEVKTLVESPPAGVAPGCLAQVTVVLDGRSGVGIRAAAVQRRGGQSVVFRIEEDQARMVTVKTGRDMNGWTEILEGDLQTGVSVVTMGQQLLNDGTPVSVVQEAAR
ncbi:MAG: efflux RND transporter periplasmic adaptor subunit [Candidatus Anammoximicrobium sp.]|nr:efflux RND transporter periplasmic adaptor subunit [Candidatus Anammoximicrobium sp.]